MEEAVDSESSNGVPTPKRAEPSAGHVADSVRSSGRRCSGHSRGSCQQRHARPLQCQYVNQPWGTSVSHMGPRSVSLVMIFRSYEAVVPSLCLLLCFVLMPLGVDILVTCVLQYFISLSTEKNLTRMHKTPGRMALWASQWATERTAVKWVSKILHGGRWYGSEGLTDRIGKTEKSQRWQLKIKHTCIS